jgi:hypothetical protein
MASSGQTAIKNAYLFWMMIIIVIVFALIFIIVFTKNAYLFIAVLAGLSYASYIYKGTWKYLPQ